jgi:hypothetical protein
MGLTPRTERVKTQNWLILFEDAIAGIISLLITHYILVQWINWDFPCFNKRKFFVQYPVNK